MLEKFFNAFVQGKIRTNVAKHAINDSIDNAKLIDVTFLSTNLVSCDIDVANANPTAAISKINPHIVPMHGQMRAYTDKLTASAVSL